MNNCKCSPPPGRRRQSGVTLLEVLVAILIISCGLLGSAGMQSVGMKFNLGAAQRTSATLLANDIADRMRANKVGVEAGNYHLSIPAVTANCLTTIGCTAQQMANHDISEWNQAVAAALPSGQGIVCRDTSPDDGTNNASLISAACDGLGNNYAIKIWWLEDRSEANAAGALKRVVTAFRP
ncbi:MAG: type IV pilus modification protein PilV [Betaproteobacteria bacterium]|nr:type IV pilus modification protein PilV [Betaproteobacteria bacterium]